MTISGLNHDQRVISRDRAVHSMELLLHHASEVHYSQGSDRWEGISHHKVARHGEFPRHCDCSASTTWALWNALYIPFGLPDSVNGERWEAGYTGTQIQHGREVLHLKNVLPGDLVFYGPSHDDIEHVTMVRGLRADGHPMVISQGSEPGPFYLPYDYRGDHQQIRRYI